MLTSNSVQIRKLSLLSLGVLLCLSGYTQTQSIAQMAAKKYRQSVVFLSVKKITSTGAEISVFGTGFVTSKEGHILTSCHVVDRTYTNEENKSIPIDKVEIQGAVASRFGTLEAISNIHCSQSGFDLALLKFRNSSIPRLPIPISGTSSIDPGALIASMGFPLDTEFMVRQGTIGGTADGDMLNVSLSLNRGDSGGPVFDEFLQVVGVAEAGYAGAGIGIVRPIRHAAGLLAEAGILFAAVNANITSSPIMNPKDDLNVETAPATTAARQFAAASSVIPTNSETFKITYPVSKVFSSPTKIINSAETASDIALTEIKAQTGYQITSAKLIVTAKDGVDVVNVNPSSTGQSARVILQKANGDKYEVGSPSFLKGFIEMTQKRIK